MAIGDIFKVSIVARGPQDQELVNTLYYRQEYATVFDTPQEDLAQAFLLEDGPIDKYIPCVSNQCSFDKIEVRGVTDPTVGFDLPIDPPRPGGITEHCLPPGDACVVTFTTGRIGRAYRGRNYLFPAGEGDQASGVFSAGYLSVVGEYADVIQYVGDGVATAEYQQVVHSSVAGDTPVTGKVVRTTVYHQRRRTQGVGA